MHTPRGGAATPVGHPWTPLRRFARRFITDALTRHRGNISKAAEEMGLYRQQLQAKLQEYGLDPETFRRRDER